MQNHGMAQYSPLARCKGMKSQWTECNLQGSYHPEPSDTHRPPSAHERYCHCRASTTCHRLLCRQESRGHQGRLGPASNSWARSRQMLATMAHLACRRLQNTQTLCASGCRQRCCCRYAQHNVLLLSCMSSPRWRTHSRLRPRCYHCVQQGNMLLRRPLESDHHTICADRSLLWRPPHVRHERRSIPRKDGECTHNGRSYWQRGRLYPPQ